MYFAKENRRTGEHELYSSDSHHRTVSLEQRKQKPAVGFDGGDV